MRHPGLLVHAANSAATLAEPAARFGMVRCGIAIYGMDPFHRDPADHGLEPALELVSYVAEVKRCAPGQSAGYGRRFVAEHETWLGTVPIGYGDGVRRALTNNADVLVDGRRVPLVGTVSMDNITVDLGPEPVRAGRRGGADRRARRGPDPRRGRRRAARHDQLRGHVRDLRARAAGAPAMTAAPLEAAREALAGREAWLVGGAVRDQLLGRPTDDVDVALEGDPREAARTIARATGGAAFRLSDAFGAWRVVGPGHGWHVDLVPLRDGDIAADLAARDFTINAMAEPLGGGELLDPHGGRADLDARRVRMVSEAALADDPLRALRAVRLVVELGLELEPATGAAVAAHAAGAGRRRAGAGVRGAQAGGRGGSVRSRVCG